MNDVVLEATLARLRAEAARRCGLDAYPAEAIRRREESVSLAEERRAWGNYLAGQTGRTRRAVIRRKGTAR